MTFLEELREQRWDDHRYYHHNRINQSLHLFSASCFLAAYVLVLKNPVAAAFIGWVLAMVSRQIGHFFFEPKDYDVANQATHEYKESIKIGYNLSRKMVLLTIWALTPLILYLNPALMAAAPGQADAHTFLYNLCWIWILLGIGGVAFRVVQLFFQSGIQTGLVWATKILTDPFHDWMLYHKAPLQVLRGEMYDPIVEAPGRG